MRMNFAHSIIKYMLAKKCIIWFDESNINSNVTKNKAWGKTFKSNFKFKDYDKKKVNYLFSVCNK